MERSGNITVSSPNVNYTEDFILADYEYQDTLVTKNGNEILVRQNMFPILPAFIDFVFTTGKV